MKLKKALGGLIICLIFFLSFWLIAQAADNNLDSDNDGLTDNQEINIYYTNANYYDTDGDGYDDNIEIKNGYSSRHAGRGIKLIDVDSDNDGLNDKWELIIGTDILNSDTDGDSYSDGSEVANGYDPLREKGVKADKIIKVNLAKQNLAYYFNNKLLESFPISSGIASLPTPKGNFKILAKVPVKAYKGVGYYYPNTKWNLHFTTGWDKYYIHGAYWHNNFGRPMSHGCVNVPYDKMERLYEFSEVGTRIEIS